MKKMHLYKRIWDALKTSWFIDVTILILLSFSLRIVPFNHFNDFSPDEIYYVLLSQEIYNRGLKPLFILNYIPQHLSLARMRLSLSIIVSIVFRFLRTPSMIIARLVCTIINSLVIPSTYLLGRVIFEERKGRETSILASVLFAFNFGFWVQADRVLTDSILTLFIVLFLLTIVLSSKKKNNRSLPLPFFSGILLIAILFTKPFAFFLLIPTIVTQVIVNYRKGVKTLFQNLILMFLPLSILMIYFFSITRIFINYLMVTVIWQFSYLFDFSHPAHRFMISALWRWVTIFLSEPDIQGVIVLLALLSLITTRTKRVGSIKIFVVTWLTVLSLIVAKNSFDLPMSGISGIRHYFPILPIFFLFVGNIFFKKIQRKDIIYLLSGIGVYILFSLLEPFDYFIWVVNPIILSILIGYLLFKFLIDKGLVVRITLSSYKEAVRLPNIIGSILLVFLIGLLILPSLTNVHKNYKNQPYWYAWYEAESWLSNNVNLNDRLLAFMPGRWRVFSHHGIRSTLYDIPWENRSLINPKWIVVEEKEFYPSYMLEEDFLQKNNITYVAVTRNMFRSIDRVGESSWGDILSKEYLKMIFKQEFNNEICLALFRYEPGH